MAMQLWDIRPACFNGQAQRSFNLALYPSCWISFQEPSSSGGSVNYKSTRPGDVSESRQQIVLVWINVCMA